MVVIKVLLKLSSVERENNRETIFLLNLNDKDSNVYVNLSKVLSETLKTSFVEANYLIEDGEVKIRVIESLDDLVMPKQNEMYLRVTRDYYQPVEIFLGTLTDIDIDSIYQNFVYSINFMSSEV